MTERAGTTFAALPPRPLVVDRMSSYTMRLPSSLKLHSTCWFFFLFILIISSYFRAASSRASKNKMDSSLSLSVTLSPSTLIKCLPVGLIHTPRYPGTLIEPSGSFSSPLSGPECDGPGLPPFFFPTPLFGPPPCPTVGGAPLKPRLSLSLATAINENHDI